MYVYKKVIFLRAQKIVAIDKFSLGRKIRISRRELVVNFWFSLCVFTSYFHIILFRRRGIFFLLFANHRVVSPRSWKTAKICAKQRFFLRIILWRFNLLALFYCILKLGKGINIIQIHVIMISRNCHLCIFLVSYLIQLVSLFKYNYSISIIIV